MNKNVLKNSQWSVLTLMTVICVISLSILMQSCSKDEEQPLDEAIVNSPELEEYIIAGADFQQSLAIFEKELNKVDFSKLEVTYDAEGRKVMRLPEGAVSMKIEAKLNSFNEKKTTLVTKFPQFASFKEETGKRYFEHAIQNSVKVTGAFLKLGINTSRTLLKSGSENQYDMYENLIFLQSDLYNWINSAGYTEVVLIIYSDGSVSLYHAPGATANQTSTPSMTIINGNLYYTAGGNSNPVVSIGHTHRHRSNPTQPYYDSNGNYHTADYYDVPSGVNRFIYYDWGFHYY